jgi:hypothetical protein
MTKSALVQAHNAIILNPSRGVKWMHAVNRRFVEFMANHPKYLQHFVLPNNNGKDNFLLLQCEKQILWDWVHSLGGSEDIQLCYVWPETGGYSILDIGGLAKAWDKEKANVHKFIMKQHKNLIRNFKAAKSVYTYGRGRWTVNAIFVYPHVTQDSITFVENMRAEGRPFSPSNRSKRALENGSPGLKKRRTLSSDLCQPSQKDSTVTSTPFQRIMTNQKQGARGIQEIISCKLYLEWRKQIEAGKGTQFLGQYDMLKEIMTKAGSNNLWALRLWWEDVFTTQCKKTGLWIVQGMQHQDSTSSHCGICCPGCG